MTDLALAGLPVAATASSSNSRGSVRPPIRPTEPTRKALRGEKLRMRSHDIILAASLQLAHRSSERPSFDDTSFHVHVVDLLVVVQKLFAVQQRPQHVFGARAAVDAVGKRRHAAAHFSSAAAGEPARSETSSSISFCRRLRLLRELRPPGRVRAANLRGDLRRVHQVQRLRDARLVAPFAFAHGRPHRPTEDAEEVRRQPVVPDLNRPIADRPAFELFAARRSPGRSRRAALRPASPCARRARSSARRRRCSASCRSES